MTDIKTYKEGVSTDKENEKPNTLFDEQGNEYFLDDDGTKTQLERRTTLITKKDMPNLSDEEIYKMNNVLRINRVVLSTIDSNENLRKDLKTHYDVVRVTLNILSEFGVLKDATKALEELNKNEIK
jgi:hypothetical protein